MKLDHYLFFNGRCEEAIQFYQRALGAKVQIIMRNRESPEPPPPGMLPPGSEDKIMHATLVLGSSVLMLSDGRGDSRPDFKGFAVSLSVDSQAEAERVFGALSDGGSVQMPLAKTFWAPCFGMATDRFGVQWMVGIPG